MYPETSYKLHLSDMPVMGVILYDRGWRGGKARYKKSELDLTHSECSHTGEVLRS